MIFIGSALNVEWIARFKRGQTCQFVQWTISVLAFSTLTVTPRVPTTMIENSNHQGLTPWTRIIALHTRNFDLYATREHLGTPEGSNTSHTTRNYHIPKPFHGLLYSLTKGVPCEEAQQATISLTNDMDTPNSEQMSNMHPQPPHVWCSLLFVSCKPNVALVFDNTDTTLRKQGRAQQSRCLNTERMTKFNCHNPVIRNLIQFCRATTCRNVATHRTPIYIYIFQNE